MAAADPRSILGAQYLTLDSTALLPEELPEEKLYHLRENDPRRFGRSGRVQRSRRLPAAKTWYASHNLQGQEDDLAETFPAGLRNKRLKFVIGLVMLNVLLVIVSFAMLMHIFSTTKIHSDGGEAFVVVDGAVQFKAAQVSGYVVAGTASNESVSLLSTQPTLTLAGKWVDIHVDETKVADTVDLKLKSDGFVGTARRMAMQDSKTSATPFLSMEAGDMVMAPYAMEVDGDLTSLPDSMVRVSTVQALPAANLLLESSGNLDISSFRQMSLTSDAGYTSFSAASSIRMASEMGVTFDAASVALDMARVPRPVASSAAYALCACPTSGSLYLMPGDMACGAWSGVLASNPCA